MIETFFCACVALCGCFVGPGDFFGVAGAPLAILADFGNCLAEVDLACRGD